MRERIRHWYRRLTGDNTYIYLDVCRRFPFAAETFHYIFSEHLIEHLTLEEGEAFLRECFRCLKVGGRIRIATPDLCRVERCKPSNATSITSP